MRLQRWRRREFLQMALANATLFASLPGCGDGEPVSFRGCPEAAGDTPGSEGGTTSAPEVVAQSYFADGDLSDAEDIGDAYLELIGLDESDAVSATELCPTVELIESSASDAAAVQSLVEAVRCDFAGGNIVSVHGWTLSVTEVHLCALLELA